MSSLKTWWPNCWHLGVSTSPAVSDLVQTRSCLGPNKSATCSMQVTTFDQALISSNDMNLNYDPGGQCRPGGGAQWSNSGVQALITSWEIDTIVYVIFLEPYGLGFLSISDTWHVTRNMWHLTYDIWHVISDIWNATCDTWRVTCVEGCLRFFSF